MTAKKNAQKCKDSANATLLSERVYKYIWDLILKKELSGGDKIPEQRIIKDLNISRTPVRETIQRFIGEGLAESTLNHSAKLIAIDDQFLNELGVMRLAVDTLAVRLAIYNGSNREFNDLQRINEECLHAANTGNSLLRIEKDVCFHKKLTEIANNRFLVETLDRLQKKNQLYFIEKISSSTDHIDSINQHYSIIEALRNRDVESAISCVANHLIPYYNIQELLNEADLFNHL